MTLVTLRFYGWGSSECFCWFMKVIIWLGTTLWMDYILCWLRLNWSHEERNKLLEDSSVVVKDLEYEIKELRN